MKTKRNIITLGLLLAVIIAAIVIFLVVHSSGPSTNVFLSGGAKGKGAKLYIPAQLQANSDNSNYIKLFSEFYPASQNTKTTVLITTATVADAKDTASQIKQTINSRQSAANLKFTSVQGTFMQAASATGPQAPAAGISHNKFDIDSIKPFTNKHIKANAWQFNFTLARAEANNKSTKIDGTMIYVIGNKAYYRLVISSTDDNWKSNQPTWKRITDSLSINQ